MSAGASELGQYPVASAFGLDHQDVRRQSLTIELDGRLQTAGLDVEVSPGEPSVAGGNLHGLGGDRVGAEGVDVDARHERHDAAMAKVRHLRRKRELRCH